MRQTVILAAAMVAILYVTVCNGGDKQATPGEDQPGGKVSAPVKPAELINRKDALALLGKAEAIGKESDSEYERTAIKAWIATTRLLMGETEKFDKDALKAIWECDRLLSPHRILTDTCKISRQLARAGKVPAIEDIFKAIPEGLKKKESELFLIHAIEPLITTDRSRDALQLIKGKDEYFKFRTPRQMVMLIHASSGNEKEVGIVQDFAHDEKSANMLRRMAAVGYAMGGHGGLALKEMARITDSRLQNSTRRRVASLLAEQGQSENVQKILPKIKEAEDRAEVLASLGNSLARKGKKEEAQKTLMASWKMVADEEVSFPRLAVMADVTCGLARAGFDDDALRTFDVTVHKGRLRFNQNYPQHLDVCAARAAGGHIGDALDLVRNCTTHSFRRRLYDHVLERLGQAGDLETIQKIHSERNHRYDRAAYGLATGGHLKEALTLIESIKNPDYPPSAVREALMGICQRLTAPKDELREIVFLIEARAKEKRNGKDQAWNPNVDWKRLVARGIKVETVAEVPPKKDKPRAIVEVKKGKLIWMRRKAVRLEFLAEMLLSAAAFDNKMPVYIVTVDEDVKQEVYTVINESGKVDLLDIRVLRIKKKAKPRQE